MKLLVTVDVERGDGPRPYQTVVELDKMMLESDTWTLFVTPDVVQRKPDIVSRWREEGHDIGLHIHPNRYTQKSDWLSTYSEAEIRSMIERACNTFESILGFRPYLFRAGRWEHSTQLIDALRSTGFRTDCSLLPDKCEKPFSNDGIIEYPLTIYSNPVLRPVLWPWTINGIPQTIDNFLSRSLLVPGYYVVAQRTLLKDIPYFMVAFHDYDAADPALRSRMRRYIDWLNSKISQEIVSNLKFE